MAKWSIYMGSNPAINMSINTGQPTIYIRTRKKEGEKDPKMCPEHWFQQPLMSYILCIQTAKAFSKRNINLEIVSSPIEKECGGEKKRKKNTKPFL